MDITTFKLSLRDSALPPTNLSIQLESLWYDARGDWHKAHDLVNDLEDKQSAYVHAYLHRKEGDLWNADYWYRRAGQQRPDNTLEEEWEELVRIAFER